MTRGLVLAGLVMMMVTVTQVSGQSMNPPPGPVVPPPVDRMAVPLEQAADAIVVLVPDETFHLNVPLPNERVIRGSVLRQDKGPMPTMIVHTANTFTNPLHAGVPVKLFLSKFKDRDAYYIIGVHPNVSGEKL
jgi:hypothetical protein